VCQKARHCEAILQVRSAREVLSASWRWEMGHTWEPCAIGWSGGGKCGSDSRGMGGSIRRVG